MAFVGEKNNLNHLKYCEAQALKSGKIQKNPKNYYFFCFLQKKEPWEPWNNITQLPGDIMIPTSGPGGRKTISYIRGHKGTQGYTRGHCGREKECTLHTEGLKNCVV